MSAARIALQTLGRNRLVAVGLGLLVSASLAAVLAPWIAPYDPRPRELAATVAIQAKELPTAERHIVALTVLEPDREIHRKRLDAVRKMAGQ